VDGKVLPAVQLVKREWYDPRQSTANFVVLFPTYPGTRPFTGFTGIVGFPHEKEVLATFGQPARTYHYRQYTILVWNKNLLADMAVPAVNDSRLNLTPPYRGPGSAGPGARRRAPR